LGPLYYGYGWYVWKRADDRTIVFHDGSNGIHYASLRLYRDDGRVLTYASNVSAFSDTPPVAVLDRLMLGDTVTLPPVVTGVSATAGTWSGRYSDESGNAITVANDGSALRITGTGQRAFTFVTAGNYSMDPVMDSLNAATTRFHKFSRAGLGDSATRLVSGSPADVGPVEQRFWARRDSAFGRFEKVEVLGTRAGRQPPPFPATTYVAVHFARGTAWREFVWDSTRTIVDYGPLDAPPFRRFYPTSGDCVTAVDAATARSTSVCFRGTGPSMHAELQAPSGSRRMVRRP
ncbi:MAG: hypothetical protein M3403_05270, partial [Gemmatimonadota bacterium]|nr:hypothetical protein [Gemmatimonadota bacterium]